MTAIGSATESSKTLLIEGVAGTGDNAVVIEVDNAARFNEFALSSSAGSMDVDVSLDGNNFIEAIALEDKKSTNPQTRVTSTVAGGLYRFFGTVRAIRIRQNGGTAVANAVLACGKIGR